MSLSKSYLIDKIGPMLSSSTRDPVIERLTRFDPSYEQSDMVKYLQELLGRNPKFPGIIKQYALLYKNIDRHGVQDTAVATVPHKHNQGGKKNRLIPPLDACECMATRHDIFGSCANCGKIFCVQSKIRNCNFCNTSVLPCMSADDAAKKGMSADAVEAYAQKVS